MLVKADPGYAYMHLWIGSPSDQLAPLPGPWFNIKLSSYQYRKSHCGDKTVVRSSYLHNGISYTGKMTPQMTYCELYLHCTLNYYANISFQGKCIWKCHVQNGSHFVSASMCSGANSIELSQLAPRSHTSPNVIQYRPHIAAEVWRSSEVLSSLTKRQQLGPNRNRQRQNILVGSWSQVLINRDHRTGWKYKHGDTHVCISKLGYYWFSNGLAPIMMIFCQLNFWEQT